MSHAFKIRVIALSLTLIAALSSHSLAQSATPSPTAKIGIVNAQEVISECDEGKKELDALQAKFAPKQAELKKLNEEVENLKKQNDSQKNKVNPGADTKTIEAKQKTLQRNFASAQNELQRAEQEVINRIGAKLMKVLDKYAKGHGYALVLDIDNPQTPVIWSDPGMNITKELIQAYNTENPATAQAPSKGFTMPTGLRSTTPNPAAPASKPKKP
jgi:outer membrane protein